MLMCCSVRVVAGKTVQVRSTSAQCAQQSLRRCYVVIDTCARMSVSAAVAQHATSLSAVCVVKSVTGRAT